MVKTLKYVSSTGEEINLRDFSCKIYKANLHSYSWNPVGNKKTYGINVTGWEKDALAYELQVAVRGNNQARADILNHLTEVTERDVITLKTGKLYFDDYYLNCYVVASTTAPSESFAATIRTWQVYAPYPFWIKEEKKSFYPQQASEGSWLDYDYNYNYDYALSSVGAAEWMLDHYAVSNFLMTIYGYVEDPQIIINGHAYTIYTTLEANEYLQIESKPMTVKKYLASGDVINIFNYRSKSSDVFEKLPSGLLNITWSGTFGFDITAFIERSEPRW